MSPPRKVLGKVVGVSFVDTYPENVYALERMATEQYLHPDGGGEIEGIAAVLIRNPQNEHDPNAIEVHVPALGLYGFVGHLGRGYAARLAPEMDAGARYLAEITSVVVHPEHPDRPGIEITMRLADVDG